MASEMMQEILEMIEAEAHSRPTPFEYELAYQARGGHRSHQICDSAYRKVRAAYGPHA